MKKKKFLIVNADDFGLTKGVSDGILQAHKKGIVTSTSVMMNQQATYYALENSKSFPRLSVGVHLVFTSASPTLPLSEVSSLTDKNENFYTQYEVYKHRNKINLSELFKEFCYQVDSYIKYMGKKPSHLDCHHFAFLYPPFFKTVVLVANKFNLPIRYPIFYKSILKNIQELKQLIGGIPPETLDAFQLENNAFLSTDSSTPHTDYFDPTFFGNNRISKVYLKEILHNLNEGVTELMVHPGLCDQDLINTSSYTTKRVDELNILTDNNLFKYVHDNEVELISYYDLENIKSYRKEIQYE